MVDPTQFILNWSPNPLATSQTAKYRQKSAISWNTSPNLDPANPLLTAATTVAASGLTKNVVYEFQVDSNCSGTINSSDIYESIIYTQQNVTDNVTGGVISVNQDPMPTVETIDYRLVDQMVVIQNIQATGIAPQASFTAVSSGTYTVEYRYGTTVNGVSLYSNDATQHNAWYTTGNIIVP